MGAKEMIFIKLSLAAAKLDPIPEKYGNFE